MSHDPEDFVGDLQECKRTIKGLGGSNHYNMYIGTLKWHCEDDQEKMHKFLIPKSYFVPEGWVILLSPQHYDHTQKNTKPTPCTMEITEYISSTLHWKQRQSKEYVC